MAKGQEKRGFTPKGGSVTMHGPGLKKPGKSMMKTGTKKLNQPIKSPGAATQAY